MRLRFDEIYGYDPVNITEEAYQQIVQIIKHSQVCEGCGQTCQRIVTLNKCADCFIRANNQPANSNQSGYDFQYITYDGERYSWFLNQEDNYIYVLDAYSALKDLERDHKSILPTLRYWKFPVAQVPDSIIYTTIYGDLKNDAALVVNTTAHAYLIYREGEIVEINRKTKAMRELLDEAAAATRQPEWKKSPWPELARIVNNRLRAEQERAPMITHLF